jgi:hypothetical protein
VLGSGTSVAAGRPLAGSVTVQINVDSAVLDGDIRAWLYNKILDEVMPIKTKKLLIPP